MRKPLLQVYLITALVMIAVASVGMFGILKVKQYHINKIKREITQAVFQDFDAIQTRVKGKIKALEQTELFFRHSDLVTRKEFALYAQGVIKLYPEIKALEWLPIITDEDKDEYEISVQNEGFPNFFISEKDSVKGMIPIRKKQFYIPVHFIEPMQGNEVVFGLDSTSNKEAEETIKRVIKTGKIGMTPPIDLIQENQGQKSILIYVPHFSNKTTQGVEGVSDRRLKGLVLLIIKMDEFLQNMGSHFSRDETLKSRLLDQTNGEHFIAGSKEKFRTDNNWHIVSKKWNVAGRDWLLQVNHDVSSEPSYQFGKVWSWVVVVVVLLITFLLTYLIYSRLKFKEVQTKATLAFKNEEDRYKKLLNSSADAYFLQDMQGKLLDVNKVACDVMGYTQEELLNLTVFDINEIIEGTTKKDYIHYFKHFPKGKTVVRQLNYRKKDGTIFPVEISLNKFSYNDTDVLSGFIRDISERKEYENSLKQATKRAQAANQAKSEFLAKMSHEFRTPMHSILSFSDMGMKRIRKVPLDKIEGYFQNIQISGKRLMKLLNGLLDLAKLETGKLKFSFEKCSMLLILDECIAEQELLWVDKNIEINVSTGALTGEVICDADKIQQVITNLLSNAIKFADESSSIIIQMNENFDILSIPALKFSISDQGQAIPELELVDIFDKFVQSSKVSATHQGTGLGLAICKEIIEGHSGRIWAENIEAGAQFNFAIPFSPLENFTNDNSDFNNKKVIK